MNTKKTIKKIEKRPIRKTEKNNKKNIKNFIKKNIKYLFVLAALIIVLFIVFKERFKEKEKINCYDYIANYLNEEGWNLYNNNMFSSKTKATTFLILNNNFITMKIGNSTDRLNIYLDEDKVYLNENNTVENQNVYEKYKEEIKYSELKEEIKNIHKNLEKVGCPLHGENPNTIETYKTKKGN